MVDFIDPVTALRRFFYLVTPQETSFQHPHEVPNYVNEALPYFIILVCIEYLICVVKQCRRPRMNDSIGSLSAGILSQVLLLFGRSVEITAYLWCHSEFCLVELPWDNPWTWILGFLGVDFGYYWLHRMSHEMNLSWSGHQVHHSSEMYNLTTALRQSVTQRFFGWIYYMPLALFMPPSIFLVHLQFNLIYQFWIHTELIRTLGPLEWILNTPSHHRVHHGRNPYCIDKNYGGTLIIFDRIFGTFAAERAEEAIAYGLVHPLQSLDPIEIQLCHLHYVWSHFLKQKNWRDRLRAIFYGPGWDVGKPRLGDPADIPPISREDAEKPVYDPPQSNVMKTYCGIQFISVLLIYLVLVTMKSSLSFVLKLCGALYVILSLTAAGNILDPRSMQWGATLEKIRIGCAILAVLVVHWSGVLQQYGWMGQWCWMAAELSICGSVLFWLLCHHFTTKQNCSECTK